MGDPFIGSEALAAGQMTRHALRTRCVAIHPDVYLPAGAELSAATKATAAYLWTRRQGIVAGRSAAVLHGARWVDSRAPAEIVWDNRRAPAGLRVWSDGVPDDEVQFLRGMRVTTPARTALDIACRNPQMPAVAAIDALARATRLELADVERLAERHTGRRGIRRARHTLGLVDSGAESPPESRLRLLVVRNGFPRPQTQIPVYDEYGGLVAELDMGWRELKIALDYEGDHHRKTRAAFNKSIRRHDAVSDLGWIDIRVTAADSEGGVMARLAEVWRRRVCAGGGHPPEISPWTHVRRGA